MAHGQWSAVLEYIRAVAVGPGPGDATDSQLLERFRACRDEAAFADLVQRHGSMVLGVCRRLLRQEQDAEDAFQATFLVLARRAGSIRRPEALGSWLYGVAARVARKVRTGAARRRHRERPMPEYTLVEPIHDLIWEDVRLVLDEEVGRLPRHDHTAFVTCYLEGKTLTEAARQLGWPRGTVATRLARARDRLRVCLARRGLALSAGLLTGLVTHHAGAAVPPALATTTVLAAELFVTAPAATGTLATPATTLAQGVLNAMFLTQLKIAAAVLLSVSLAGTSAGFLTQTSRADREAQAPAAEVDPNTAQDETPAKESDAGQDEDATPAAAEGVTSVAFSPDVRLVATGRTDKTVRFWDVRSGKEIRTVKGHQGAVNSVAFSPDGKILATASADKQPRLWELVTGKEVATLTGHTGAATSVAFAPDGRTLATGSDDKTARLWDVASGKEVRRFGEAADKVRQVAFTPDGRRLAVASQDGDVRVWDLATGRIIMAIRGHRGDVRTVAFGPDGTLASGGADKTVRLWDVATGKALAVFEGFDGAITALAFSPNGQIMASGSADKSVRLWDTTTHKELVRVPGHTAAITAVAFSPDGRLLVTGSKDKTAQVWELQKALER